MRSAKITPEGESAESNRTRAVVACTDPEVWLILISVLSEFGLQPILSETLDHAKGLITQEETVMAFVQPRFSDGNFHAILRAANGPRSRVPVILCSDFYDKELYIEAMSLGAFDYLSFPYRREDVAWVVNNALSRGSLGPSTRPQGEA
jgi:DNA-binding NtrC family response regulator